MKFSLKPIPSPVKRRCTDRTSRKPPLHTNSVPEAAVMIRLRSSQETDDWLRLKAPAWFWLFCFYRAASMQGGLSHELPVRLLNAWIVEKRKKYVPKCLYHIKGLFILFCDTKNGWWARHFVPEISGQTDPVASKTPLFDVEVFFRSV